MSTPYTSLTATDVNWCSVSMWNELTTVANQISLALGLSTKTAASAGQNAGSCVSSTSNWTIYDMQRLVTGYYTSFLPTSTVLEGRTTEAPPSNYSSLSAFYSNAGMNSTGFRRVTGSSWPSLWTGVGDAAYSFGYAQPGDVIGPWNWADLRMAFDEMSVVLKSCTWDLDGTADNDYDWGGYGITYANAVAVYTSSSSYPFYRDSLSPRAGSYAASAPYYGYYINGGRCQNQALLTFSALSSVSSNVVFYQRATASLRTYSPNEYYADPSDGASSSADTWHAWSSGADTGAYTRSGMLGGTLSSRPTVAPEPTAYDCGSFKGWIAGTPYARVAFNWAYSG